MTLADVSCVALDMIGVLVQEERLISRGMVEYFGNRLRLPIDEIKDRYDSGFCVGTMSRQDFWSGLLVEENWQLEERRFLESRAFNPETASLLATLQDRCEFCVISDMPREWAQIILESHALLPALGVGMYSDDGVGSKKDGRLFQALLDTVGLYPEHVLLVDDRPANLARAAKLGIRGVWLPLEGHDTPTNDTSPEIAISGLLELVDLLAA